MTDRTDYERATDEVLRRSEAARSGGRDPAAIDAQLASQFVRSGKDPLWFERLDSARAHIEALQTHSTASAADARRRRGRPGRLARLVDRLTRRRSDEALTVLDARSHAVDEALASTLDAIDELRTVIVADVFGDIDAVHHRLVSVEQELSRLRAAGDADRSC